MSYYFYIYKTSVILISSPDVSTYIKVMMNVNRNYFVNLRLHSN